MFGHPIVRPSPQSGHPRLRRSYRNNFLGITSWEHFPGLTAYLWTAPCGLAAHDLLHRPPPPAWRLSRPHLPARPSARYKDAFVPRRFFNNSLLPFPPLSLSSHDPRRVSGLGELHLPLAGPLPPPKDTTRPVRQMPLCDRPL